MVTTLAIPASTATLRATDARGNVYATGGRLVTVDPVPAGGSQPQPTASARRAATEDFSDIARNQPHADACGEGQVRCFNVFFYAIDTVVPLVALGQRSTWYANPNAPWGRVLEWWLNTAALIGWLFTSIFLLSFTRLARGM